MAVNVKFDLVGNPEPPTIILAKRNGDKLGQLDVNAKSIELSDKFNDASEISFTLNKYVDGKPTPLWDKVVDFKLVWCKEWNLWFEIKVELDEATETVKTVFCTQLGQAELSQINLYDIHINEEGDPNWNTENKEYKSTILYDPNNTDVSLLHRLLKDKAPHYSILHVDDTIKNIQRSFSFDDTSIYDAFQEVSEEIGCLFVYHSNSGVDGKIQRVISVYDLQQNCLNPDCRHRGEFTEKCPKCGGTDINYNEDIFEDTRIFVTSDELATEGIQLTTDTDSVKNCFKLKGGDDLMTATIRNCNPNGTDYLWRFSDMTKDDMSNELVEAINSYNSQYKDYYDEYKSELDETLVNQYNALVEKYKNYYNTESTCLNCGNKNVFDGDCPKCNSGNVLSGKSLQTIPTTIRGYSALMNAYYNTIDLALYLQSGLMPTVAMSETSAEEQANLLTSSSLSSVAVNTEYINSISQSTADSAILSMAKIIVKPTYKVEIKASNYNKDTNVWEGNFVITNYSDENDTAESQIITTTVNNDTETFIKQKIEKALNKDNTDDLSISGLFEKDYDDFCAELKKYALNPLKSFYDACDNCLNILIDQGVGDEKSDLYEKLYIPYYNKSSAIASEIAVRENEIIVIEGKWDKTDEKNPVLKTDGLQQCIEKCRNTIQSNLNFEEYLGKDLWLEFCSYRRDDTYSNDNYISDGLNNAQLFERALEFIEAAENEIYKSSELQHSISTSLNNLLKIDKFKSLVDSFAVGNWIRVRVDDEIFKLRLLEYDIDFGSFENISVEFSDVTKIKNGITDIKDVIDQASSMATNYSSIQRQADQGNKARTTIDQWIADGLNSALVQIQSNSNEEVTMTENGLLCRSYDEITGNYSPEQLRLTHNIMAYTDNNWETVKQAIGKHNYKHYDENQELVDGIGYGVSSTFVSAGYVSGSQIIGGDIYSSNYIPNNQGTHFNLINGEFQLAGGNIVYKINEQPNESSILKLKNVEIEWSSSTAPEVAVKDVSGLQEYIDQLDEVKTLANQNKSIAENAKNIGNQLVNGLGFSETEISGQYVISPVIAGGTLLIGDQEKTYAQITKDGKLKCKNAEIDGRIIANSGGEIAGFTFVKSGNGIFSGTRGLNSTTPGIWLGIDGIKTVGDPNPSDDQSADDGMAIHKGGFSRYRNISDSRYTIMRSQGVALHSMSDDNSTYYSSVDFYLNETFRGNINSDGFVDKNGILRLDWNGDGILKNVVISNGIKPEINDSVSLGTSNNQWSNIYATTSTIGASDRNIKDDINPISDSYEQLFYKLNPVSFTFKNGTSGRTHIGFISQDVESAMNEIGMTSLEFAGFCKDVKTKIIGNEEELDLDKDGNKQYVYSLRYGEFVALNTYIIQKLSQRISDLEHKLGLSN